MGGDVFQVGLDAVLHHRHHLRPKCPRRAGHHHRAAARARKEQPAATAEAPKRVRRTKEQIAAVERSIGKKADGTSLSKVMGEYEQLDLERQFSQTMLTSALQALDQARANAAVLKVAAS